ncbi:MAG: ester cyclase [Dehalococcoidia bacterium]|nr:ester cyclase [Dehalococcoidia bacterium]
MTYTPTEQTNIELTRRLFDLLNDRELAEVTKLVAPTMIRHDLSGAHPGVTGESVADFLGEVLRGAPDLRFEVDDIFGGDDRVAVRLRLEGTHLGPILGRAPTGKRVSVNQVNLYRFYDGKVAETWQMTDLTGFFHQIGR